MVAADGILFPLPHSKRESLANVLKPKDTDTRGGIRHGGDASRRNRARVWAPAAYG
jgi:hypothetical protein